MRWLVVPEGIIPMADVACLRPVEDGGCQAWLFSLRGYDGLAPVIAERFQVVDSLSEAIDLGVAWLEDELQTVEVSDA